MLRLPYYHYMPGKAVPVGASFVAAETLPVSFWSARVALSSKHLRNELSPERGRVQMLEWHNGTMLPCYARLLTMFPSQWEVSQQKLEPRIYTTELLPPTYQVRTRTLMREK